MRAPVHLRGLHLMVVYLMGIYLMAVYIPHGIHLIDVSNKLLERKLYKLHPLRCGNNKLTF
jgi:hypothetical protein